MKRRLELSIFKSGSNESEQQKKNMIVELYSFFDEKDNEDYSHEIIGNLDIGIHLRNLYGQTEHLIYSLDKDMVKDIKDELNKRRISANPINLTETPELEMFQSLLNGVDTLIIIAQGNLDEQKIADLDAESFIELLREDFEMGDRNLNCLELFCCKMANAHDLRESLKSGLYSCVKNIISYPTLLAANEKGRVFIEEADENSDETDRFYSEDKKQDFQQIDQVICPEKKSENKV